MRGAAQQLRRSDTHTHTHARARARARTNTRAHTHTYNTHVVVCPCRLIVACLIALACLRETNIVSSTYYSVAVSSSAAPTAPLPAKLSCTQRDDVPPPSSSARPLSPTATTDSLTAPTDIASQAQVPCHPTDENTKHAKTRRHHRRRRHLRENNNDQQRVPTRRSRSMPSVCV